MSLDLLARLALILALAAAPVIAPPGSGFVAEAWADDDDDDRGGDDDDDDDDDRPRRRAAPQRPAAPRPKARPVVPEIVVAGIAPAAIDALVAAGYGVADRAPFALLGGEVARLRLPRGVSIEAARRRIAELAPDAAADLNHLYRPSEFACTSAGCTGFAAIAWPSRRCGAVPSIGMVDTPLARDHPAFADATIESVSVLGSGRNAAAPAHGTAIAALFVGNPESRTPGLVPDARLVAVSAFHRDQSGDAADAFALVRALDVLAERKVQVANLSFAGPANAALERAVWATLDRGIAIVASAGNGGAGGKPVYPGAYPDVIAVTAVDAGHELYRQAGRGEHVDFAAPGVRLWTAAAQSGGRFRSGTSYATPFVSAALAVRRAETPDRPLPDLVSDFAARALDLGQPGRDPLFGHGLVQAGDICPAG